MLQHEVDLHFLKQAYIAARYSDDPRTQNGAVLVYYKGRLNSELILEDYHVLAAQANHLPKGVRRTDERLNGKDKYASMIHAETAALYAAWGTSVMLKERLTLFGCWIACSRCAQAIIECGVRQVVGHDIPQHHARADWAEDIALADAMLREAGVKVLRLNDPLGMKIRFAGEVIDV